MALLLVLLLLGQEEGRIYHLETPTSLAQSRWTHVELEGRVVLVKREKDGDVHFRLADAQGRWIVCELIPLIRLPAPKRGQQVRVRGIRRWDSVHHFAEVHPVETIAKLP
jgi:hypothetical protein